MWKQRERLYSTSARTAWDNELFFSNMYPPNLTVDWIDTDQPENAQYERDIHYTFNEHGFRGDSLYDKSDINILCCGCSLTFGVGVDDNETWPSVLKQKIAKSTGKTVTSWNLATSGASPDYVSRTVWKLDPVLWPDFVFVFWPPISRLELPHTSGVGKIIQTAIGDEWFPKSLVDEDYLQFSFLRNLNFIKGMFQARNKRHFYCNPVIETLVQNQMQDDNLFLMDTTARDGMHPGPEWHEKVAEYYFQQAYK